MRRYASLFVFATAAAVSAGCKSTGQTGATGPAGPTLTGEAAAPLLIGPEATSKAPPPVELPGKDTARLCVVTAQHYEKEGRVENAIELYEKARTTDPSTAKVAARRLAVLYDKVGNFTKSTAEYEALLTASPKDADLLSDYGYSHYSRGAWANAEGVLLRAVQADPNHKKAWVNLGLAQAQLGKWAESYQSFCHAVREADAHCNIAFVMAAQGNAAEAKERYRLALTLDPGLRAAQIGLTQLENPKVGGKADAKKAPFDPVLAASQVPSIAQIEARLKSDGDGTPVVLPASQEKSPKP